jgi:palmitoyltransferase
VAAVGVALYMLLNWCYTTAVFTPPGSTTNDNGYSTLPTHAVPVASSLTVKSNGELRFCKKCQARKPDRAHHCSTCRRCVLKMDHHCPWLATCVGLRNHKAFLLFLIYTSLFCLYCFAAAGAWVWEELFATSATTVDNLMPVNYIMLSIIAGIIGIVISAFCGWHIYLAAKGQTTIECLEKTRYLSPLRRSMHQTYINQHTPGQGVALPSYGQQLLDIHQNALPGITRPEEGEELRREPSHSPRFNNNTNNDLESALPSSRRVGPHLQAGSRRFTPDEMERYRARRRYEEYLDEQDSTRLPNAFDLGPKRNLLHLFGSNPWLWPVPVCNTSGDGWSWEPNPRWVDARDRLARERAQQAERERAAGWGAGGDDDDDDGAEEEEDTRDDYALLRGVQGGAGRHYLRPEPRPQPPRPQQQQQRPHSGRNTPSPGILPGRRTPSKADRILGRDPNLYADAADTPPPPPPPGGGQGGGEAVSLKRLNPTTGRTVQDELDEIDRDDDGDEYASESDDDKQKDGVGSHQQQQQKRAEAERHALNVVTNGRWGRSASGAPGGGAGGASTLLRGPASPALSSPGLGRGDDNDDGVD